MAMRERPRKRRTKQERQAASNDEQAITPIQDTSETGKGAIQESKQPASEQEGSAAVKIDEHDGERDRALLDDAGKRDALEKVTIEDINEMNDDLRQEIGTNNSSDIGGNFEGGIVGKIGVIRREREETLTPVKKDAVKKQIHVPRSLIEAAARYVLETGQRERDEHGHGHTTGKPNSNGNGAGTTIADQARPGLENLDEIHRDVLSVAKAAIKKKKYAIELDFAPPTPIVQKIIDDCMAKFHFQKGYTKDQILEAIKTLERDRWIVTAQRRTRDEVLGSDIYKKILRFLFDYPGIHARDKRIEEHLGITRNPFLKHLLVLERFGLIEKRQHGKVSSFFLRGFKEHENVEKMVVLLYNDVARQIVKILLKEPSLTLVEIASKVVPPVFHGAVQYHLKKFEKIGLITRENDLRVVNREMLSRYNELVCEELQIKY